MGLSHPQCNSPGVSGAVNSMLLLTSCTEISSFLEIPAPDSLCWGGNLSFHVQPVLSFSRGSWKKTETHNPQNSETRRQINSKSTFLFLALFYSLDFRHLFSPFFFWLFFNLLVFEIFFFFPTWLVTFEHFRLAMLLPPLASVELDQGWVWPSASRRQMYDTVPCNVLLDMICCSPGGQKKWVILEK